MSCVRGEFCAAPQNQSNDDETRIQHDAKKQKAFVITRLGDREFRPLFAFRYVSAVFFISQKYLLMEISTNQIYIMGISKQFDRRIDFLEQILPLKFLEIDYSEKPKVIRKLSSWKWESF